MPAPDRRPAPKPIINEPTVNNTSSAPPPRPRGDVLNAPTVNNARPPDATPGGSGGSGWSGGGAAAAAQEEFTPLFLLGEGGMGRVLLARHPRFQKRWVALKQLSRDFVHDPNFRARFDREAEVLSRMKHENIIGVTTRGEGADGPWIAMEYVAGPEAFAQVDRPDGWGDDWPHPPLTLQKRVLRGPKLTPDRVLELGCQLCRALEHAHKNGILHRDIKPANILLSAEEVPMLADFGLAREADPSAGELTNPLGEMGTPYYQPPEMVRNPADVDARADLYMLAGTLMFALTGQPPIYCRPDMIDARLRPALEKAHHPDRNERYASAAALREALEGRKTAALRPQASAPGDHVSGGCAKCGHVHRFDPKKGFTRTLCEMCGAALFDPCAKCGAANGVWVKFCECGVDLAAALHGLQTRLAAEPELIKKLRAEGRFAEALERLKQVAACKHSGVKDYVKWAETECAATETAFAAARADAQARYGRAKEAMAAFDDVEAVRALGGVAPPQRTPEMKKLLEAANERLARVANLDKQIRAGLAAKQYDGLLGLVVQFLSFRPLQAEMLKLREKLQQYEAGRQESFWAAVAEARRVEDYRSYLERYPGGPHEEAAREGLAGCLRGQLLRSPKTNALRREYLENRSAAMLQADRHRALLGTIAGYAIGSAAAGLALGAVFGGCHWAMGAVAGVLAGALVGGVLK